MSEELARQEEAAEVAYAIEKRIKAAAAKGRQALWEMAEALYEFDQEHGWQALGHEKLSDWLADPDVTMTMGTYRRYVRTWRKLVIEKQVEPARLRELEQSKVAIVVDAVAKNEVTVDDAFADVEALGAGDLREKYYQRRAEAEPSNVGQEEPIRPPFEESEFVEVEVEPVTGEMLAAMAGIVAPESGTVDADIVIDSTAVDVVEEAARDEAIGADPAVPFAGYEFPGWITEGSVQSAIEDLSSGVDSGAAHPRVSRRACQVALELATAWLTTAQG